MASKYGGKQNIKPASKIDDMDAVYREHVLNEKSIDIEAVNKNLEQLRHCRFYSAILGGSISGIFSLTGLNGLAFYLLNFLLFSFLLFFFVQSKKGKFFLSSLTPFTYGLFTHVMVYVIFWVLFYNLVHIY